MGFPGGDAMIDERKRAEQRLINDFARWEHLYTCGGQDPCWEDGYNLNLVRNHIIHDKRRLEELKDSNLMFVLKTIRILLKQNVK